MFAILFYFGIESAFDVVLDSDGIEGGATQCYSLVVHRDVVQKTSVDGFPQSAVLEFVLGASNRVVQLDVGVELIVIVNCVYRFIHVVQLGGEEVIFETFGALPKCNGSIFGVLADHPRVFSLVTIPDAHVSLQPEP